MIRNGEVVHSAKPDKAAEEVRSPGRALPLGTMSGMITLLIAAAITWYVVVGLLPWEYTGWDAELAPLFDAAKVTGSPALIVILFVGTLLSAVQASRQHDTRRGGGATNMVQ